MGSFTRTVRSTSRTHNVRRIVLRVALVATLLVVAGIAWFYAMFRSSLPQVDGQLHIRGLTSPVKVFRDQHGIPQIEAANLDDLFFAQGFVTAQDRLWQMDGMRRFAAGELSEILGDEFIAHDRKQRILGLRETAEKTLALATPDVHSHFDAYARGVNAYIQTHRDNLPAEFQILRYRPGPWTPEDSTLIAAQMVEDLSTTPMAALTREKILAKLGPEFTTDLYINNSRFDRPPNAGSAKEKKKDEGKDEDEDDADGPNSAVAELPMEERSRDVLTVAQSKSHQMPPNMSPTETLGEAQFVVGSNNWVVSGAHTTTGKPLLSSDMHLGYQMPNLWYEAHLHSGTFDVAGVTLPGMPYVVVGHNETIAWGFTNIGPTVEDAYIEIFNGDGNYLTPSGWQTPQHRREIIKVKGKPDVVLDVVTTRHGPIVSELVPGEKRKVALRWTLYDGVRNPFFAVNSAQNWKDFRAAFSQLDAPAQNVVYADTDGNIGYQATGKIPIRASGDGSLPEDGSSDRNEWAGYVPFDKLPSVYNPSSGILATANGRITKDDFPFSVSAEWEAPWRTARIYRVLESGKKFAAADMLSLQTDIDSEFDRIVAGRFVNASDSRKNLSPRAKTAVEILQGWDGRMAMDSAAPTIAVRAREELERLLLEPKLGAASEDDSGLSGDLNWKSYQWLMKSVWIYNVLQDTPKRWLPSGFATYDDLLCAALDAAVTDKSAPADLRSWTWGDFNSLTIQHPVFGKIPILRRWSGPGVQPQSGSVYSVKAVSQTMVRPSG